MSYKSIALYKLQINKQDLALKRTIFYEVS